MLSQVIILLLFRYDLSFRLFPVSDSSGEVADLEKTGMYDGIQQLNKGEEIW